MNRFMNIDQVIRPTNQAGIYSFPRVLLWFLLAGLVAFLIMIQTWSLNVRDAAILVLVGLFLSISLRYFDVVWVTIVVCLPFIYTMARMFDQPKISALRIFLVILLGAFILRPKSRAFWSILFKHPTFLGLVLFFVANLISSIRVMQIEAVFRALTYLESVGFFLLSYYFVRRRPGNWKTLLWAIGVSGVMVILLGLLEVSLQKPLIEIFSLKNTFYELEKAQGYLADDRFGVGGRISSILLQPVHASLFFGVYLVSQTYYIVVYKKQSRYLLFALIPIGLVMVFLTGTRGTILALSLAIGSTFLSVNSYSRSRLLITEAGIVGFGLGAIFINYQFPYIFTYMSGSFDQGTQASANFFGRIDLTLRLIEIFRANPFFGYGTGLIQKAASLGVPEFLGLAGIENQYATILADGGILTGAAYLLFVYGVFSLARKASRSKNLELRDAGTFMFTLAVFYFTVVISVFAISAVGGYLVVILVGGLAGLYDWTFDNEKMTLRLWKCKEAPLQLNKRTGNSKFCIFPQSWGRSKIKERVNFTAY